MRRNIFLLFVKNNKYQIIRFLITGVLSTFLNFIVYKILYESNININIASFSGYSIGLINSFLLSKIWVFNGAHLKELNKSFIFFTFIYLLGGIEMIFIINIGTYFFGNYELAWVIGALSAAINNYLGSKFLLFKN